MSFIEIHEYSTSVIEEYKIATATYRASSSVLEARPFTGCNRVVSLTGIDLCYRKSEGRISEQGELLANGLMFIFPESKRPIYFCSQLYTDNDQIIAVPNKEIYAIYPREFSHYSCAINFDVMSSYFSPEEREIIARILKTDACRFGINQPGRDALQSLVKDSINTIVSEPDLYDNEESVHTIKQTLCRAIADYVTTESNANKKMPKFNRRLRLVNRCLDYIHSKQVFNVSIADMATAVHASSRTIQYAFMDILGLSSMQYIIALRMNAIRQAIIHSAGDDVLIKDIINRYGIANPGRLSKEYADFFGEYPKDTRYRLSI